MKKILLQLLVIGGLMALPVAANAVVVSGEIRNIDGDNDGQADDLQIQRIFFTVTAGTSVFFDSLVLESTAVDLNGDGEITGFDNFMRLFSGTTNLASNDDSGATFTDGSVHGFDSTINWTFGAAGTYMITVGQLYYEEYHALQGYEGNRTYVDYMGHINEPNLTHGDWRLTMTATNGTISDVQVVGQVPDGGSTVALLGLALTGLAWVRRKARR